MIKEDYVSFETAKLLKEKGFDFCCEFQYINCSSGRPFLTDIRDDAGCYYKNSEIEQDAYSAPTLQMAMKWLREVHNLYITITHRFSHNGDNDVCFGYYINTNTAMDGEWLTYEEACEAAIKYCLELLP